MNFQKHLENLRAKPDHKKKQFAFWTSFGFSALLFIFWVASFNTGAGTATSTIAKAADKAGTPAQSLVASVGSVFTGIKDYFIAPKVIQYKEIEAVPGN